MQDVIYGNAARDLLASGLIIAMSTIAAYFAQSHRPFVDTSQPALFAYFASVGFMVGIIAATKLWRWS